MTAKLALLALAVTTFIAPQQADAAAARVGAAATGSNASASTSFAVTFGAAPTNGNTMVAIIATRSTTANAVGSIAQTGVYWSRVASSTGTSGTTTEIWVGMVGNGATTGITVNLGPSVLAAGVVMEYSGLITGSATDKTAQSSGNSTAAVTGTTATTFQADELWIGGVGLVNSTYTIGTPLNSFTAAANASSTNATAGNNARVYALERIVTATGAASSGGTVSTSSQWSGAIVTFRASLETCTTCHGGVGAFTDTSTRNAGGSGRFPGSHNGHVVGSGIACAACHVIPASTGYNHANGQIQMANPINDAGGAYGKAGYPTWAATNSPTAFATCTNTNCHGAASPAWAANTSAHVCTKCHGTLTTTASPTNAQMAPSTGAHQVHVRGTGQNMSRILTCWECHNNGSSTGFALHMNGTSTVLFTNASTANDNSVTGTWTSGTSTCSVYCHGASMLRSDTGGTGRTPVWTNSAYLSGSATPTAADCRVCHGNPPTTGTTAATHASYVSQPTSSCATCHNHFTTSGTFANETNRRLHIDGILQAAGGHAFPYSGSVHRLAAGATAPAGNCSCHNSTATSGTYPVGVGVAPACRACHISGLLRTVATVSCYDCHGASATNGMPNGTVFPNNALSHNTHVVGQGLACADCHNGGGTGTADHGSSNRVAHNAVSFVHVSSSTPRKFVWTAGTSTCSTVSCHGTAVWGVTQMDCVTCHDAAVNISNGPLTGGQRRAVAAELRTSGSRNHKGTAIASAATKWDCIVCHMEGNMTTGSSVLGVHGNGVLDLRDPDTGAQIKKVQWTGTGAAGAYSDTLTNFTTARFSRNLGVTLENDPAWLKVASIQQNLCIKCHDSNGATNSNAWTKNSGGTTVGTAQRPFGLAVGSTSTLIWVNATTKTAAGNTTGAVMDVATQLAKTNASYHPVVGKGNNGFTGTTMMKAPWNATTVPTAKVARTNTVYGWLVSCFDCHAALGTTTGVQTSTVVAHGNQAAANSPTMRAVPYTTQATASVNNLCTVCHAISYATTSNNHPTGSGFNGGSSMGTTTMGQCFRCHGALNNTPATRAVSGHGHDSIEGGPGNHTSGRTYSFIRGSQWNDWAPGSCNNTCTTRTYSPGGMY